MKMKELSHKQPFAELILLGRKKIELRTWNTKFRGEFLIHASAKPDFEAMRRFGFDSLPYGVIVGKAKLIDVHKYNSEEEHSLDRELHLADNSWGDYGFVLSEVERFDKLIPAKG